MKRLDDAYFERKYAADDDPWSFETSAYEHRKYDLTLAALPRPSYRSALEPGCSFGVLTERLAPRCEQLLALEAVAPVAERARRRVAHLPAVEVRQAAIPEGWPPGGFDLVVLSEVGYYLTADGLAETLERLDATLVPGGHLLAVHWRGETDYPLAGDEVHAALAIHAGLARLCTYEEDAFLLGVFERA